MQSDDSAQSEDLIQSGTSSDQPAEETKSSVKTDIAEVVSSESDVEADATETQGENEKTIEGNTISILCACVYVTCILRIWLKFFLSILNVHHSMKKGG